MVLPGSTGRRGQAMMKTVSLQMKPDNEVKSSVIVNYRGKTSETRFGISMENHG